MSGRHKKTPGTASVQGLGKSLIEELHYWTDIVQETSLSEDPSSRERQGVAIRRIKELLGQHGAKRSLSAQQSAEHRWVLDVLLDLARYCQMNELTELHRLLMSTRFNADRILHMS